MPKIAVLGKDKRLAGETNLDNIDIKGNSPGSTKLWIYAGLALAAWLVYKNKSLK